ncbi:signal peptidase II [Candidatus Desantisbacteria bacterium]|nr:signal peptidase II [Candidatus Desantisbacteria bacterium]
MLLSLIAGIIVLIDQITKYYIKNNMFSGESIPIIPGIFHITYIQNSGGAFGMFQDKTAFFIIVSITAIILLIFFYFLGSNNLLVRTALAIILGGAIGNLIDRIMYQKVVDFFDLRIWPIFNVADIAICIGMGLLLLDMFNNGNKINSNEVKESVEG